MRSDGDGVVGRALDGMETGEGAVGIRGAPQTVAADDRVAALVAGLQAEIAALKAALARAAGRIGELEALVEEDDLTGLLNRRGLYREFGQILGFGRRYGFSSALVYLDLDGFKATNDRYGHAVGDAVLIAVARRIRAQVRDSDVVGRLGGDEFIIVLRQADLPLAEAKAAALRRALESEPVAVGSLSITLAASLGVAVFDPADSADDVVTRADRAMFRNKRERKVGRDG